MSVSVDETFAATTPERSTGVLIFHQIPRIMETFVGSYLNRNCGMTANVGQAY